LDNIYNAVGVKPTSQQKGRRPQANNQHFEEEDVENIEEDI